MQAIKPVLFFFFNDTAPPDFYSLPLHDALPIWASSRTIVSTSGSSGTAPPDLPPPDVPPVGLALEHDQLTRGGAAPRRLGHRVAQPRDREQDRKSTRLNSSHSQISYAVFCLKKK